LFAILGIIFGIIFVKNWYYNETKNISYVPIGANYPLSIIVSILAIVLLACISGLIFAWKVGRNNENSIE
jgi:heme/copper-type cytochrome/quinol oxidase subunit 2